MSTSPDTDIVEIVNANHFKTRLVAVAVAALLIVTGAIGAQLTLAQNAPQYHFSVGVINNTTTPAQGDSHPEGQIETECDGFGNWRTLAKSWHTQVFDCYPSTESDPFDVQYKARLADDANGNPVYHTATVTISCPRSMELPLPPNTASSASFSLTGSGTGITASNVTCHYPQSQQQQPSGD